MLVFGFLLAESALFWILVEKYDFGSVLLYYWAPTLVGFIFLGLFARQLMFRIQTMMTSTLASGKDMSMSVMSQVAILTGIILLLLPFMTARLLAILLLLPGFRHLILWKFQKVIAQKVTENFKGGGGNFNAPGFKFYYKSSSSGFNPIRNQAPETVERDVTGSLHKIDRSNNVIDITPIIDERRDKKDQ